MKSKMRRLTCVLLLMAMAVSLAIPTYAAQTTVEPDISTQASAYINSYSAGIEAGTGSITITFTIAASGRMTSLGASRIDLYKSDGTLVKTYLASSTEGMLASNRFSYAGSVEYTNAKKGTTYYAVVTIKASNSSGGDSRMITTVNATAK